MPEKVLGRGGSATVYLARRGADSTPVALKVLDTEHTEHTDARIRLEREFAFARRVDHRHVVTMYEHGPDWLAMQYVDGGDIGHLGSDRRMRALAQIADGLDHTHRAGIVHCDVKPTNILVHRDFEAGGAVLIDFGVAHSLAQDMAIRLSHDPMSRLSLDPARRITRHPEHREPLIHASLPYAAPELLLGRMPAGGTDLYALACTAVELLTGAPPFPAGSANELIEAHLDRLPPPTGLARGVDSVLAKALAKDPEARYGTCQEFIDALVRALR